MREEFKESFYKAKPGYPSEERVKKGPVVLIECAEEIPCNPCETACPFGAITVGYPITNLPILHEDKCKGCGRCISVCPGLAIFLLDFTYSDKEASLMIPYEFLPLPEKGEEVDCLNREGKPVCKGRIVGVVPPEKNDRTALVTFSFPKKYYKEVRNFRLKKDER